MRQLHWQCCLYWLHRSVAQQPRNRPASTAAPVNNLKIKYKTNMGGQSSESTTMIRGTRERSEMKLGAGMEIINITQCDLKRTVQLSDTARKYVVTPMDAGGSDGARASSPAAVGSAVNRRAEAWSLTRPLPSTPANGATCLVSKHGT